MISRDPEMVSGMINNNPEKTMKKVFFYIAVFAAMVSCAKVETPTQEEQGSKLNIITATVKNDATKVAISTSDYTLFDHLWQTGDQVSVIDGTNKLYTLATGNGERTATFSGESALSGTTPYYAIYPYDIAATLDGSTITTTFPATQTYTPGSYDKAALVMIGKGEDADNFGFKLASSIIQITLTPSTSYTVKKVEITANGGESIAGTAQVNYDDGMPNVTMTDGVPTVSVTFGDGLAMTAGTPYTFYVALPAVTLSSGVSVAVTDSDNNLLLKKSSSLSLTRNYVTKMPALTAVPNIPNLALTNSVSAGLATPQTANCYLVNAAGTYAIPIDTKGNSSEISLKGITSVEEEIDVNGQISDLVLYGKYMKFVVASPATNNNAVVAAKVDSDIVWSWHIWTNTEYTLGTGDVNPNSGDYTYMPLNIGAITKDGTDTYWTDGCLYQWGRKDPLILGSFTSESSITSISESIKNPTKFSSIWFCEATSGSMDTNNTIWCGTSPDLGETTVVKTIYDPSPVGYSVPPAQAFENIRAENESLTYWNSTYNGILWNGLFIPANTINGIPGNFKNWLGYYCASARVGEYRTASCYYAMNAPSDKNFSGYYGDKKNAMNIRPIRNN